MYLNNELFAPYWPVPHRVWNCVEDFADAALRYRPKPKSASAKKRKRRAAAVARSM